MRVTHIITRLILGGAQENTAASVLGLLEKPDLEVNLISGPTSGPEGSLESLFTGLPGVLLIEPCLVRPVRPWTDWLALLRLTQTLRRLRPQLVHTHSGKAGVIGRLAAARAGVPLIIHTVHGPSFGRFQGALPNKVFRFAEARAAKVTDHFVVVADAMKDQYLAAGIGHPSQYTKVFSGFDLEPFLQARNDPAVRAELGFAPDDIVAGKIARLVPLKGHEDLLKVAPSLIASNPKLKFLLIGDGELRQRYENQVQNLGLKKNFVFTGLVPPATVARFAGIMDVLVHLSAREGLPRALPQALAAGHPVIAYDRDGASEVCRDNETGFLLKPGDLDDLKRRLLQLSEDAALRLRMGNVGRQWVRERFSTQRMVDDLHQLYQRLANLNGSPARDH